MREAISEIAVPIAGGTVGLTAAVGVATTDLETSVPDLLDAADRAMYADKRRPDRT